MPHKDKPTSLDTVRKRWEEQLREIDEAALIVLKGHLLIEEMLETIISTFVFHPPFIKEARLTFANQSLACPLNVTPGTGQCNVGNCTEAKQPSQ